MQIQVLALQPWPDRVHCVNLADLTLTESHLLLPPRVLGGIKVFVYVLVCLRKE